MDSAKRRGHFPPLRCSWTETRCRCLSRFKFPLPEPSRRVDFVHETPLFYNFFFQVPPAELEALLISHPNIDDAAVIGVPDVESGELPKAFVVRHGELTSEDVIKFVARHVPPHKKLRGGVEFVDQIPKSASGKILRRELRSRHKRSKL